MKLSLLTKPATRGEASHWLIGGAVLGLSLVLIAWVVIVPAVRWIVERAP